MASESSGGSVPWSGSTSACGPSEHKGPEVYPPNNKTVPVERLWPARVHYPERRPEDPEPLLEGGGEGDWMDTRLI